MASNCNISFEVKHANIIYQLDKKCCALGYCTLERTLTNDIRCIVCGHAAHPECCRPARPSLKHRISNFSYTRICHNCIHTYNLDDGADDVFDTRKKSNYRLLLQDQSCQRRGCKLVLISDDEYRALLDDGVFDDGVHYENEEEEEEEDDDDDDSNKSNRPLQKDKQVHQAAAAATTEHKHKRRRQNAPKENSTEKEQQRKGDGDAYTTIRLDSFSDNSSENSSDEGKMDCIVLK
jgi:hypothetical protein